MSEGAHAARSPSAGRRPTFQRVIDMVLVALGLIVFVSVLLVVIVFIDDRYGVGHVPGTWMALASETLSGRLYPPLAEDGYFGGTRYMPLPILALAGAAAATGEFLVSGKMLALLGTGAILLLTWLVLRRVIQCSHPISLALTASIVVAPTGLLAATSYRGDALPVALQVAALGLLACAPPVAVGIAGVLTGLAFLSKLSAVWALVAGIAWLAVRERKRLPLFLVTSTATIAIGGAVFEVASSGRMTESLVDLSIGRNTGQTISPVSAVSAVVHLVPLTTWLISTLAAAGLAIALRARRLSLIQVALLVEVAILVVLFTDIGSDFNHLLDITVLVALCAGELWRSSAGRRWWTRPVIGVVVSTALGVGLLSSMRHDVSEATRSMLGEPRRPAVSIEELTPFAGADVLSEHPGLEVELDRRPRVVDPFMLIRIAGIEPEEVRKLERRIRAHEFGAIFLLLPLDEYRDRYRRTSLGEGVSSSIEDSYCRRRHLGTAPYDVWVYLPC